MHEKGLNTRENQEGIRGRVQNRKTPRGFCWTIAWGAGCLRGAVLGAGQDVLQAWVVHFLTLFM